MDEISRLYTKKPIVKRSNSSIRIQRNKSSQPLKSPADRILFLQRTIGNQAVQRLIKSGTLQAKLKIGQPGDKYEQEADRVAEQVLRMPEPGVQREVEPEEEEEEEEKLQRQTVDEKEEEAQAKATSGHISKVSPNLESRLKAHRGSGQPLVNSERAFFEPRFGIDLSHVKVYTGSDAIQMNRDVGAKAFTQGSDIYFGGDNSPSNLNLTAHELTHIVQQTSGGTLTQGAPGGSVGVLVQRKDGDNGNAVPSVGTQTLVPTDAPTKASDVTAKGNTTPVTFTAMAENIAGTGKHRIKGKEGDDALWFDPLNVHSDTPLIKYSMKRVGVLAGSGVQTIATFPVPMTEGDSPHGSGTVTARLKFANSATKSLKVTVKGTKKIKAAKKAAYKFIKEKMTVFGDVDELQNDTATHLAKEGFANATVTINKIAKYTKDVGESSFFYLVRGKTQILMRISTAKVGEKKTTYSGSTTTSKDIKTKEEKHEESSTETVNIDYNKAVVRTLDDKVKKVESKRKELISKLTDKIFKDNNYTKNWDKKVTTVPGTYENYTKNVKGYSEEGDKEKSNWAAKGKKGIGVVKEVIKIPLINKIPVIGWFSRKLRGGLALDVADSILGLFEAKGTVHFKDSTEDTTIQKEKGGKDITTTTGDIVIKSGGMENRKRDLFETIKEKSSVDWERYKEEIENTKEKYRSITKKELAGGSDRITKSERRSTIATFTTATRWVISKPVVEAAVVGGDGEVSSVPFKEPPAVASKK